MTSQAQGDSSQQVLGDRYQTVELLGKKAGRQTWLAQDLQTQTQVVVKLLTFSSDFEWDDLKLFEREAETLQALTHPAIPRYLNHFEFDAANGKGFALVQTYIEARSLEQHLKAGRTFSEAELKQIAKELLGILSYLHDRQPPVIHRDIKPSNVLLTNRSGNSAGQVYLVDFGSVQTLAAKEGGTITVVGTYGYMPPEQFGGRAVPASDLYSLGATLIYLATGRHPADLPQVDLRLQFEPLANLSPGLIRWLQWMVEPSLSQRLVSTQAALCALESPQAPPENSRPEKPALRVNKPFDTKVQLEKSPDHLEILMPSRGLCWGVIGWGLLAGGWNWLVWATLPSTIGAITSVLPSLLSMLVSIDVGGLFGLACLMAFILIYWSIGLIAAWKVLFSLFGRVRVRIDRKQMTLAYELLGVTFQRRSAPTQTLCKLLHTKMYLRMAKSMELSGTAYVKDKSRLVLWAGTKQYEICDESVLTNPELDWLAYELSGWLGLPIARD